jgi:hypothetical protein
MAASCISIAAYSSVDMNNQASFGNEEYWMGRPFHNSMVLRAEFERRHLDFIRAELKLCLTFAAIADVSFKARHRKNGERNLAIAQKHYSDMSRFFSRATGITTRIEEELQSKLRLVGDRLDGLLQHTQA